MCARNSFGTLGKANHFSELHFLPLSIVKIKTSAALSLTNINIYKYFYVAGTQNEWKDGTDIEKENFSF